MQFEELPSEDQPPREIWLETDLMEQHWKMVKARNAEKYGLDQDIRDQAIDGPVDENDAMDEIFPGMTR